MDLEKLGRIQFKIPFGSRIIAPSCIFNDVRLHINLCLSKLDRARSVSCTDQNTARN